MTIRVNGEPMALDAPVTLERLLAILNVDPRRVAVEQNGLVIKRERHASSLVQAGDEIEIVNFVGGG